MDTASLILTALALCVAIGGLWCGREAFRASQRRIAVAWIGRALALFGAAVAIWFPAELYAELGAVVARGGDQHDLVWLPRAIWWQIAVMPLTVIPALVALRSTRIAGLLFLAQLALVAAERVVRPFGVIYPDMSPGLDSLVFGYGPTLVTAIVLLAGRAGPALRRHVSGGYLTLGPA